MQRYAVLQHKNPEMQLLFCMSAFLGFLRLPALPRCARILRPMKQAGILSSPVFSNYLKHLPYSLSIIMTGTYFFITIFSNLSALLLVRKIISRFLPQILKPVKTHQILPLFKIDRKSVG